MSHTPAVKIADQATKLKVEKLIGQPEFQQHVAAFRKAWKLPADGLDLVPQAMADPSIRELRSFKEAEKLYEKNHLPVEALLDDPKYEDYYASYWHWSDQHGYLNNNLRSAIDLIIKDNSLNQRWAAFIKWYLFFNDPNTHVPKI